MVFSIFSIRLHTIKSGWSTVYTEGTSVMISNFFSFLPLKIDFVTANNGDSGELQLYVAIHQGLHCLPKYLFRGFWSTKG